MSKARGCGHEVENCRCDESVLYLMGRSKLGRMAYALLLREELGLEVRVDSGFAPTAVWSCMRSRPDLVLVETDTPHTEVLDAVDMIGRLQPQAKIIAISATVDPLQVEAWSRCVLHAYVVKDAGVEELRAAIEAVQGGQEYFGPGIREALMRGAGSKRGLAKLSRREAELLPLLARGLTLRDAAREMTISYKTADSYRTSLLRKLGVHDRVELTRYAIRRRIIDP